MEDPWALRRDATIYELEISEKRFYYNLFTWKKWRRLVQRDLSVLKPSYKFWGQRIKMRHSMNAGHQGATGLWARQRRLFLEFCIYTYSGLYSGGEKTYISIHVFQLVLRASTTNTAGTSNRTLKASSCLGERRTRCRVDVMLVAPGSSWITPTLPWRCGFW